MAYWEASGKAQGWSLSWPPGPSTLPSSAWASLPLFLLALLQVFMSCFLQEGSYAQAPCGRRGQGRLVGGDRGAGTGFSQALPSQACLWAVLGAP